MSVKPRVLSGIQPSGELHVGNYLGAVRTWVKQIEEQDGESARRAHRSTPEEELLFCVVDAHAITVDYEPADLRARISGPAIDLISCVLDPGRCTLFVQSEVREQVELAWFDGAGERRAPG